ncbi:MAG: MmpS family transport accessory protein [Mycobacterium sp.]
MTDSPRRDEPTQRLDGGQAGYSGYSDPAYAAQSPYGTRPTEALPAYPAYDQPAYGYDQSVGQYGQYGSGPYGGPPPPPGGGEPPEPPGTPRWLWIVAAIAVVTVIGLVIALVIVNSSQQETVVAPVPTLADPGAAEPTISTAPPTTTRRPTTTTSRPAVPPTTTAPPVPGGSGIPGVTESVTYNVTGQGRVINITYVDNGGVLQTEFNVLLPWSKTVDLAEPAKQSASVSIINVGRQVDCSITVAGAQIQQRTGSGLTICSPIG